MKFYYAPGACSLAVHIALRETGAAFEAVRVDLATHTLPDGSDYRAIAPRGYVPLLEWDDGTRVTEAAALLQFVADLDPARALIGTQGTPRRRAVIEALAFVASELHKLMSPWLWSADTAESTRVAIHARLRRRFAELEARLSGERYLTGEFSVADAYAFAIVNWTNFLSIPLDAYPNLRAWMARVAQRPRVRDALAEEALVAA